MPDDNVPFDYYAKHDDKRGGWYGVFTYPKAGVQHVAYVRRGDGTVMRYREDERERAEHAASRALVDALNAEQKPVEGREIEFPAGKRARALFDANRLFRENA